MKFRVTQNYALLFENRSLIYGFMYNLQNNGNHFFIVCHIISTNLTHYQVFVLVLRIFFEKGHGVYFRKEKLHSLGYNEDLKSHNVILSP